MQTLPRRGRIIQMMYCTMMTNRVVASIDCPYGLYMHSSLLSFYCDLEMIHRQNSSGHTICIIITCDAFNN